MDIKKGVFLIGILLIGIGLAGCQSNAKSMSKQAQQTTKDGQIKIVGNTFAGQFTGSGTSGDPDYDYLMTFKADGTFRQDITATNGYFAKFVELGDYTIDKKKANIVINIKQVIEVTYDSEYELTNHKAPSSYDFRVKNGANNLTQAENKPINIAIKKDYLLGSVNGVQLRPTNQKVIPFKQFKTEEQAKTKIQQSRKTTTSTSPARKTTSSTITQSNSRSEEPTGGSDLARLKAQVASKNPDLQVTNESEIDTNMAIDLFNLLLGSGQMTWADWRKDSVPDDSYVITAESDGSYKLFFQGTGVPTIRRFGEVAIYGMVALGDGIDPTDYEKEIVDLKTMQIIGTTDIAPTHLHDNGV